MAKKTVEEKSCAIRVACDAFGVSATCYRYEEKLSTENEEIADGLLRLTTTYCRWCFGLCFAYLRHGKGVEWNHKRVCRMEKQNKQVKQAPSIRTAP